MTRPAIAAVLAACFFSPLPAATPQARRSDSRIVEQPDAPVLITAYRGEYQKRTSEAPDGLRHDLEYRSRTDQRIVAVQFGLVAFDIWNEFMDKTAALVGDGLAPQSRDRGTWYSATSAGVAFHTGVTYVERVRFESGEIWTANLDPVIAAMRAIQKDFDPANLKKK